MLVFAKQYCYYNCYYSLPERTATLTNTLSHVWQVQHQPCEDCTW